MFHNPNTFGTTAIGNTMILSSGTGICNIKRASTNTARITNRNIVGTVTPAIYARAYGCAFIAASFTTGDTKASEQFVAGKLNKPPPRRAKSNRTTARACGFSPPIAAHPHTTPDEIPNPPPGCWSANACEIPTRLFRLSLGPDLLQLIPQNPSRSE